MTLGNSAMELADLRAHQEREAGIARASAALRAEGSMMCIDCPNEIDPARRRAYPAAERCIDCQTRFERRKRRS